MHVNDQISTRGKATAKTPLKLNRMTGKESSSALAFLEQNWGACTRQYFMSVSRHDHPVLKQIAMMANTLVLPAMDALEDCSLQGDQMVDELVLSAGQHIGV